MRRTMLLTAAATFLAASNLAVLADEDEGIIVSVDVMARTVTLDNGQTFVLDESLDPNQLQIGQHVVVTYEPTPEGLNVATVVAPLT